jgi:hypothetical protein
MFDERDIYKVAKTRGCQSRRDSLVRSYLWVRNCEYIGVSAIQGEDQILFRYQQQILNIPLESFRTPVWCRALLAARIDVAEVEHRLTEERFAQQQTQQALIAEIAEVESAIAAIPSQA